MERQEENHTTGMLYLCATPIGNLEDITLRVLRVLQEADVIAAEDTRHSLRLLNHFEIKTPMTSYHEYNKVDKAKQLVESMREGKQIALITDAGTPGISDPGEELVRQCIAADIPVTALPGPAACITALIQSGHSTRRFCFEAFLPSDKADKKERQRILEELSTETRTIIVYEAPHHLKKTLQDLMKVLGEERELTICRELTKKYEEKSIMNLAKACSKYENEDPRGEYVLVIAGRNPQEMQKEKQDSYLQLSMEEHLQGYINQGMDKKMAMKQVAKDRGISKRDVYQQLMIHE